MATAQPVTREGANAPVAIFFETPSVSFADTSLEEGGKIVGALPRDDEFTETLGDIVGAAISRPFCTNPAVDISLKGSRRMGFENTSYHTAFG